MRKWWWCYILDKSAVCSCLQIHPDVGSFENA